MKILFYTPFNTRSRDTESVMEAFVKEGNDVYLLSQDKKGDYHQMSESLGVKVFSSSVNSTRSLVKYTIYLYRFIVFCRRHQIDLVYAHLEPAGLVAVIAQFFIKAKVVVCRHIVDEAYLFKNQNFILGNKIVYALAQNVIVVSQRSKDFMVKVEKINPDKITVINLAYNFNLYRSPDPSTVQKIRSQYVCKLLIITACRLVKPKRPELTLSIIKNLIEEGLDVKCIILGKGPMEDELMDYIKKNNLESYASLAGQVPNVLEYLAASDVLVHPSILDSSSVIIKEAGFVNKPVIACRDVGDVNEYLIDKENAFLVEKESPQKEMIDRLKIIYSDKANELNTISHNLNKEVIRLFSIENVISEYRKFHSDIFGNKF